MAELAIRNTHANTIRGIFDFVSNEEFANATPQLVAARGQYLETVWPQFTVAHLDLLRVLETNEERAPHVESYQEVENHFVQAGAIIQARIDEIRAQNNGQHDLHDNNYDNESENSHAS